MLRCSIDDRREQGIIHRDIKPGNIFLTARGPKISRFRIGEDSARGAV